MFNFPHLLRFHLVFTNLGQLCLTVTALAFGIMRYMNVSLKIEAHITYFHP